MINLSDNHKILKFYFEKHISHHSVLHFYDDKVISFSLSTFFINVDGWLSTFYMHILTL